MAEFVKEQRLHKQQVIKFLALLQNNFPMALPQWIHTFSIEKMLIYMPSCSQCFIYLCNSYKTGTFQFPNLQYSKKKMMNKKNH